MLVLVPLFFLLDAVLDHHHHHHDIVPFSFLNLRYGQLLSILMQSLKQAK
jgi:hypothetical protein